MTRLRDALEDPSIRDTALGLLHGLITRVTVRPGEGFVELVVEGALTPMLALGSGEPDRGVRVLFWQFGKAGCGGRI